MGHTSYIWMHPEWPALSYDSATLSKPMAQATLTLGRLLGRISTFSGDDRERVALEALTSEVIKTSAIEGEKLNHDAVRSSLARRLGVDIGALAPADRHVEGVVALTLDATGNAASPLTRERLLAWQAALFPTGRSGLHPVKAGQWRDDASGPMQVVSGPHGRQKVHFQAPPADGLSGQVARFVEWFEHDRTDQPVIKAGLAHFWFVTLHPFEDGNGRVSRALGDMLLSRFDQQPLRYYSVSAQIQQDRKTYYDILERTQKGGLDVTQWLLWFLDCLTRAAERSEQELDRVLTKATFWQRFAGVALSPRQVQALNRLMDEGFEGKLNNRKWAVMTKTSADTALRDIRALVAAGVLVPTEQGGRSTSYWIAGIPRKQEEASGSGNAAQEPR